MTDANRPGLDVEKCRQIFTGYALLLPGRSVSYDDCVGQLSAALALLAEARDMLWRCEKQAYDGITDSRGHECEAKNACRGVEQRCNALFARIPAGIEEIL